MELIYASLLLHRLGKAINEENIKRILEAAGAKAEDAKIKALVAALEGVDIESALKEAIVAQPTEKKEVKKEEKKEEKKDETAAAAGLGALFG